MAITRSFRDLLDESYRQIETITVEEAKALLGHPDVVFVDIREPRELEIDGFIPGALHAPRGLLEFMVDPQSPYYNESFVLGKSFILYCANSWRSCLATRSVQDMGLAPVAQLGGGFQAWIASGGPIAAL